MRRRYQTIQESILMPCKISQVNIQRLVFLSFIWQPPTGYIYDAENKGSVELPECDGGDLRHSRLKHDVSVVVPSSDAGVSPDRWFCCSCKGIRQSDSYRLPIL